MNKPIPEIVTYNNEVNVDDLPIFTRSQLSIYNGTHDTKLYVGIKGFVYDVSLNAKNYGPGKSYHALVGKESSRLLGLNKLKDDNQFNSWYIDDLTEKQLESLEKWIDFFKKRYKIVGIIGDHD